ncbi:CBS domain-containing protein [Streptomyces triticiradicis]|uniref:CBS domain-containing protein n=1 Tax=Streptomyces triticiradicis TaxID=2651189 RepID=A0A7J5D1D3_9ACTN|nr:CBS domain-containing protein [Streptomyces triticiradicis]KAB1976710.1 CBS domain-containing protein [Streptomyces triticiradicis]
MSRTVGEVMTREVVEAHRETSFKDVARLLDRHRISGLPVVDHDDKVVGVISETDLIRRQAARSVPGRGRRLWIPALRRSVRRTAAVARATRAQELMSTPAITVHPEQRVEDAARIMERRGVERLPVVDEEDRLIGIATRRDLLRVFLRTDEEIRQDVIDDVLTRALRLPPRIVVVSVLDGMVTLEGRLEHRSDIPFAIQLTWRVDGVVGVVNGLTFRIDDTRPPEQHDSDSVTLPWLLQH